MRNLIDFGDMSREEWEQLYARASQIIDAPEKFIDVCRGKVSCNLFYEPSTRTNFSFQTAMLRLGGSVFGFADPNSSSVAKGETQFAVSHQSQILETYQQGGVNIVCAFDEKAIENGPFAGVEGVGEKGYPYFRNRCFIMARAGTDEETVAQLKELYDKILADEEVVTWLQDTMLLEVDTMSQDDVNAHVENVKSIVNEYKDLVAG